MAREHLERILEAYHASAKHREIMTRRGNSGDMAAAMERFRKFTKWRTFIWNRKAFKPISEELPEAITNVLKCSEFLIREHGVDFVGNPGMIGKAKFWEVLYTAACFLTFMKDTRFDDKSKYYFKILCCSGHMMQRVKYSPNEKFPEPYFDLICASIASKYLLPHLPESVE